MPAAYLSSTTASGANATPSVAVPAGVAAGDIVLLAATTDNSGAVFETTDFPAGFARFDDATTTFDGNSMTLGWKRLTVADTGSYTFGNINNGNAEWLCHAIAFTGCDPATDPTSTLNLVNTGGASPRTITATGLTATAGAALAWVSAPDVNSAGVGAGHTPPAGYTERTDQEHASGWTNMSIATLDNATAGATGNVSGTFTMTSGQCAYAAWLVNIPGTAGGSPESHTGTAALTGSGTLSAIGTAALAATVALSGAGSLTAAGAPAVTRSASLSGSGSLTAAGSPAAAGGASLSGSGTLAASGSATQSGSGTAALSGTGSLTVVGTPALPGSAALSGTGALTATGTATQTGTGSAALTGTGSLTATGRPGALGTAALTGSGTLSASGVASMPGSGTASLSGVGTLTATGTARVLGVTVALAGSGTLSATALPNLPGLATLAGSGALSAAGSPGTFGGTALSGTGVLTAVGTPGGAGTPHRDLELVAVLHDDPLVAQLHADPLIANVHDDPLTLEVL